ncbi:MAG: SCO family protein [Myxococcales bacterium]
MQATTVPGKLTLHPAWVAFAALALAVPMSALLLKAPARAELPVLANLPDFALTSEDGRPFHRADLLGKVWVADFVFTSCADACPRLQNKMRRIQDRLLPPEQGGSIALLSITVDPERDTPEKLQKYAQAFGAQPRLWRYLTGPQKEVERTVVQGFHTAMAKLPVPGSDPHLEAFDIMHGERFVLVDAQGRIRGFYDADDPDSILRDARLLTPGGRG